MHDYDKNRKLDGLELLKSMTHFHDDHEEGYKSESKIIIKRFETVLGDLN